MQVNKFLDGINCLACNSKIAIEVAHLSAIHNMLVTNYCGNARRSSADHVDPGTYARCSHLSACH